MVNQGSFVEMSQSTPNGPQNGHHSIHHTQGQVPAQHHSNLDELLHLLRVDVPEHRQTLLETRGNLEKVADYCSTTYLDVSFLFNSIQFSKLLNLIQFSKLFNLIQFYDLFKLCFFCTDKR